MSHPVIVSFLTTPEIRDTIVNVAEASDRTISELIEAALTEYLQPKAVLTYGGE